MTSSRNLSDKLERVDRTINIYNKASQDLCEEISIVVIVEELIKIFTVQEGDPFFYDGYVLSESQLESLKVFVVEGEIKPDFINYYYVLEAHGIYNWWTGTIYYFPKSPRKSVWALLFSIGFYALFPLHGIPKSHLY